MIIGAAVGGSVAALAFILLLAYGIIVFRRRRGQTGVVLGGRLSNQPKESSKTIPTTEPVPDAGLDALRSYRY
jgi:hypothetical protein